MNTAIYCKPSISSDSIFPHSYTKFIVYINYIEHSTVFGESGDLFLHLLGQHVSASRPPRSPNVRIIAIALCPMSRKKRSHRANSQDDIGGESACGETKDTGKGRRQRNSKARDTKENKSRCSTRQHGSEHKAHHAGTSRREILPRAYNALVKRWDPIFSTNRPPKFSESWVECKRRLLGEGCGIDLFLKNTGYSSPLYYFDEVKELCYGVNLDDLKAGKGEAGNKRVAWLDSRNCLDSMGKHDARDYQIPLTATSLYYNLSRDLLSMRRILM
jgi:hypothetical protein